MDQILISVNFSTKMPSCSQHSYSADASELNLDMYTKKLNLKLENHSLDYIMN